MKRNSVFFLALGLAGVLSLSSLPVSAKGSDGSTGTAKQNGIEMTLSTDQLSYTAGDEINVTLHVENTSDVLIKQLTLRNHKPSEADLEDGSRTMGTLEELSPGAQAVLSTVFIAKGEGGGHDITPTVDPYDDIDVDLTLTPGADGYEADITLSPDDGTNTGTTGWDGTDGSYNFPTDSGSGYVNDTAATPTPTRAPTEYDAFIAAYLTGTVAITPPAGQISLTPGVVQAAYAANTSVKTKDESSAEFWTGLFVCSFILAIFVSVAGWKRRKGLLSLLLIFSLLGSISLYQRAGAEDTWDVVDVGEETDGVYDEAEGFEYDDNAVETDPFSTGGLAPDGYEEWELHLSTIILIDNEPCSIQSTLTYYYPKSAGEVTPIPTGAEDPTITPGTPTTAPEDPTITPAGPTTSPEEPTIAPVDPSTPFYNLVFALDSSWSMIGSPIQLSKDVATALIRLSKNYDLYSVFAFSNTVRDAASWVLRGNVNDEKIILDVNQVGVDLSDPSDGGSNYEAGLNHAMDLAAGEGSQPDAVSRKRLIVFVSDGDPVHSYSEATLERVKLLAETGELRVVTIGVGEGLAQGEISDVVLKNIAAAGKGIYRFVDSDNFDEVVQEIDALYTNSVS